LITFEVLGNPKALKRHRTFFKNGRRINTDPSKGDKADFLTQALASRPDKPLTGPLKMQIEFFMPRPKNHFGTGKNASNLKDSAPWWHTSRPDLDNMIKLVKDALDGVFYKDDSQICTLHAAKAYTTQAPRVIVGLVKL